ncbi:hypothetical protein MSC49_20250 [Methylosinus sp. C49]|uniref:hypothetical protein n=1 Tax=Methylosinus sp. C49 TaxID=2699395 RepID=UPI001367947D|nr:hypothetical protein [Methylosinus sp. C49]BBU62090.1 hypothetical protein MSC49_20250 [Methylosinus sp. C49]
MPKKLAPDATIATTWQSLTHPRDYIANVRQKMLTCKNLHGTSHVKIGVTGTGQKPCYRITYVDKGGEAIYGSYWDMHDPLDHEHAINSNWSVASMDFTEVDQLMREKFPTPLTKKA